MKRGVVWIIEGNSDMRKVFRYKKGAVAFLKEQGYIKLKGSPYWGDKDDPDRGLSEWDVTIDKHIVW